MLGPVPGLVGCLQAIEATKLLLAMGNGDVETVAGSAAFSVPVNSVDMTQSDSSACDKDIEIDANNTTQNKRKAAITTDNANSNTHKKPYNKHIASLEGLIGRQTLYDGTTGSFHTFTLPGRDENCLTCGTDATILTMSDCESNLKQNREQNMKVGSAFKVELSEKNEVTVGKYYGMVTDGVRTDTAVTATDHSISSTISTSTGRTVKPHIVLDVRSAVQFGLSSLIYSDLLNGSSSDSNGNSTSGNIAVFHCTTECVNALRDSDINAANTTPNVCLINCPLETLKGGKASASQQAVNRTQELQNIAEIYKLLQSKHSIPADGTSTTLDHTADVKDSAEVKTAPVVEKSLDIFVLCRRGIDSTVATQILVNSEELKRLHGAAITAGSSSTNSSTSSSNSNSVGGIFNIVGGLTAWKQQVEPSFPMY